MEKQNVFFKVLSVVLVFSLAFFGITMPTSATTTALIETNVEALPDSLNVTSSTDALIPTREYVCLAGKTYKVIMPEPTNLDYFYYGGSVTYESIRDGVHTDHIDAGPNYSWFQDEDTEIYYTFFDRDVELSVLAGGDIYVEEVDRNTIYDGECELDWDVLSEPLEIVDMTTGRYQNSGGRYILITFSQLLRYIDCDFESITVKNLDTNEMVDITPPTSGHQVYSDKGIYLDINEGTVTNYSVSIPPNKLVDIYGNYFAGINSDEEFQVGLSLKETSPTHNAIDVARNTSINITFNKSVRWMPNNGIYLKEFDTDEIVEVEFGAKSIEEADTKTINIHPTEYLKPNTKYYIEITNSAVLDGVESTPTYFNGLAKGDYVFTTGTRVSDEIYQYLLTQDAEKLFGGYDFALYYINDLSVWNEFFYIAMNVKDVIWSVFVGGSSTEETANAYMNNPINVEAILREIVNDLFDTEDLDSIPDEAEFIGSLFSLSDDHEKIDEIWSLIKDTFESGEIAMRWFNSYSGNIGMLESIKSAVEPNTELYRISSSLQEAYEEPVMGAIRDLLLEELVALPMELITQFSMKPYDIAVDAINLLLGGQHSIDGIDKVVSLNTIQYEAINAFVDISNRIESGDTSEENIEAYKHLFNLCKGLKLMQYREMQKNYDVDDDEWRYLSGEIASLSGLRYTSFNYSEDFEEPIKVKRLFGFLCPVDVDVYNSTGEMIAQFVNNEARYLSNSEDEIVLFSKDDEKYIVADSDTKLTFKLTGTDNGTMEFNVRDYLILGDNIDSPKTFNNVSLYNGKQMVVESDESISASDVKLFVIGNSGEKVAEINTDGTETPINNDSDNSTGSGNNTSIANNQSPTDNNRSSISYGNSDDDDDDVSEGTYTRPASLAINPLDNLVGRVKTAVEAKAKVTPVNTLVIATVQVKGADKITLSMLKQAALSAKEAGGNVVLHFDIMSKDGKKVVTRLYIKPELAKRDIILTVDEVRQSTTKTLFEKFFQNKVAVISLNQQEDFGTPVEIASSVDLNGMDSRNLFFYSYDKTANQYRRIENPQYWLDTNGYLHFTTEYGKDIVISEGLLSKTL